MPTKRPTFTPRPPTPTPRPTVPPETKRAYWLEMLSTNGGCDLPCWLGLHPGSATWEDVAYLFAPVATSEIPFPASVVTKRYDFGLSLNRLDIVNLLLGLFEKEGVVQHIYVNYSAVNERDNPAYNASFANAVRRYSLQQILADNGVPSRVLLEIPAYPAELNAPWWFTVWVFYDELGILAEYRGEGLAHSGDQIRVCPEFSRVHGISLSLQSPESDIHIENLSNETAYIEEGLKKGWIHTLQESTTLDLGGFYLTFVQTENQGCFVTPLDFW